MHERIICAGFGGQGIMLMGKLLASSGMSEGYEVSWLPSYGAEVRGGTAHSMVHISNEKISSPTVSEPDTCIVMNRPSLDKFIGRIARGGLLIVNTSMADKIVEKKSIKIAAIPLTKLAADLGNIKAANMIAVGVYAKLKKILSLKTIIKELDRVLSRKKDIILLNKKAIETGYNLIGS